MSQSIIVQESYDGELPGEHKRCNCKKAKCLKLYCVCFSAGVYCSGCACRDCQNSMQFQEQVWFERQRILQRSPRAFQPKVEQHGDGMTVTHKKGCRCRKSKCLKKYCECFDAGVHCSNMCRCEECHNQPDAPAGAGPSGPSMARSGSLSLPPLSEPHPLYYQSVPLAAQRANSASRSVGTGAAAVAAAAAAVVALTGVPGAVAGLNIRSNSDPGVSQHTGLTFAGEVPTRGPTPSHPPSIDTPVPRHPTQHTVQVPAHLAAASGSQPALQAAAAQAAAAAAGLHGHGDTDTLALQLGHAEEELLPVDGLKASVSLHSQAKGLTGALPNGMDVDTWPCIDSAAADAAVAAAVAAATGADADELALRGTSLPPPPVPPQHVARITAPAAAAVSGHSGQRSGGGIASAQATSNQAGAATMPASLLHAPTSDLLHPHVLLAEPEAARQLAARLGLDHIQQMAAYQASKILAGLLVMARDSMQTAPATQAPADHPPAAHTATAQHEHTIAAAAAAAAALHDDAALHEALRARRSMSPVVMLPEPSDAGAAAAARPSRSSSGPPPDACVIVATCGPAAPAKGDAAAAAAGGSATACAVPSSPPVLLPTMPAKPPPTSGVYEQQQQQMVAQGQGLVGKSTVAVSTAAMPAGKAMRLGSGSFRLTGSQPPAALPAGTGPADPASRRSDSSCGAALPSSHTITAANGVVYHSSLVARRGGSVLFGGGGDPVMDESGRRKRLLTPGGPTLSQGGGGMNGAGHGLTTEREHSTAGAGSVVTTTLSGRQVKRPKHLTDNEPDFPAGEVSSALKDVGGSEYYGGRSSLPCSPLSRAASTSRSRRAGAGAGAGRRYADSKLKSGHDGIGLENLQSANEMEALQALFEMGSRPASCDLGGDADTCVGDGGEPTSKLLPLPAC